jgi:hypothetical protein
MLLIILGSLILISLILAIIGSTKNIITYIGIAIIITDIAFLFLLSMSMK